MNPRRLTPDFWLVAMEETANWEKHITEQAGRIFAVYLFDRRRRVHCCELTPSYELHWLYDTFVSPNLSDRESEKLDEEIMLGCAETPPVSYFHCHEIDRILRLPGRAFHIGRDQKTWHLLLRDWNDSEKAHGEMTEALREHYQCNWMLPGRQAALAA